MAARRWSPFIQLHRPAALEGGCLWYSTVRQSVVNLDYEEYQISMYPHMMMLHTYVDLVNAYTACMTFV